MGALPERLGLHRGHPRLNGPAEQPGVGELLAQGLQGVQLGR
jgi:hypothetical protein